MRYGIAYWIEREGAIRLVRRSSKGLLCGMAGLPGSDWTSERAARAPVLGSVRHVFTHFVLELDVVASDEVPADGWWQSLDSLGEAGLPTLYCRAIESVLQSRERLAA